MKKEIEATKDARAKERLRIRDEKLAKRRITGNPSGSSVDRRKLRRKTDRILNRKPEPSLVQE